MALVLVASLELKWVEVDKELDILVVAMAQLVVMEGQLALELLVILHVKIHHWLQPKMRARPKPGIKYKTILLK